MSYGHHQLANFAHKLTLVARPTPWIGWHALLDEIAHAQKYFAVQARRHELSDQAAADSDRLELRKQTAEEFKAFSGAAQDAVMSPT